MSQTLRFDIGAGEQRVAVELTASVPRMASVSADRPVVALTLSPGGKQQERRIQAGVIYILSVPMQSQLIVRNDGDAVGTVSVTVTVNA